MDWAKPKLTGMMNVRKWAYRLPASPAPALPSVKARTLKRTTSIPMAPAACSSSRIAAQARPIHDRVSQRSAAIVSRITTNTRTEESRLADLRAEKTGRVDPTDPHAGAEEGDVQEDGLDHEVDAHRGDGQEILADAEAGDRQDRSHQAGHETGHEKGRPETEPRLGVEEGGRVRPDPHERGVAQRDLTRVARDDVQAEGQNDIDPDGDQDRDRVSAQHDRITDRDSRTAIRDREEAAKQGPRRCRRYLSLSAVGFSSIPFPAGRGGGTSGPGSWPRTPGHRAGTGWPPPRSGASPPVR